MTNHGDFKKIEAARPPFGDAQYTVTKTVDPNWVPGSGANSDEWKSHKKIELDPYEEGRPAGYNYKTLISTITPRPIALVSSMNSKGEYNLAPFSYFSLAAHDPPTFTISCSEKPDGSKDTLRDILETGELTINIISEWFIEAASHTSIDAPYGVSEWDLSGLTKSPSSKVNPPFVAESAFSIEAKLAGKHVVYKKNDPTAVSNTILIVEGINFHIREDVINDERNIVDTSVLKPMSRLGGISYGRTIQSFECLRPHYEEEDAAKAREVSKQKHQDSSV
ncbi:hypothetical protein CLIB1423_03S06986 [[Candida] railenensis]|uniref:Flavin reductase like domain-containing protein n=1 Tax=[Candida] railenensis TaxID=45579 RepID=A0A9P0VX24_9ASCO|nr:hypothetical protein CLIB1423_03S06986 [[Candida] railenensis]